MEKHLNLRANIALGLIFAFLANTLAPLPIAQADEFRLPAPGTMVHLSPEFNPPILKGIKVHPDNPFRFDFILDKGESQISNINLKDESSRLIKYFLASLTIPEKDLWVNLSPYEKSRIVPESFGQTEMGRDLLAEDYMLKQITASLIYPEDEIGKKFWKRIYAEAANKFGTTNIPVNTFNKVWIVPDKAVVYENAKAGTAYVVESSLKVMLEEDYLSMQKHADIGQPANINSLGSQVIREIVIPELTTEINQNKSFAQLRQVYNSLILATWYKKKIRDSILSQVYADKKKVTGVGYKNSINIEAIYQRYLQAFKKGAYNYIKEEQDPITQQMVSRKYFSGGARLVVHLQETTDGAMINAVGQASQYIEEVRFDQAMATISHTQEVLQGGIKKARDWGFEHERKYVETDPQDIAIEFKIPIAEAEDIFSDYKIEVSRGLSNLKMDLAYGRIGKINQLLKQRPLGQIALEYGVDRETFKRVMAQYEAARPQEEIIEIEPNGGTDVTEFFTPHGRFRVGFKVENDESIPGDVSSGFGELVKVLMISKHHYLGQVYRKFNVTNEEGTVKEIFGYWNGAKWRAIKPESWELYKFMVNKHAMQAPGEGMNVTPFFQKSRFKFGFYWEDGVSIPNRIPTDFGIRFPKQIILISKENFQDQTWVKLKTIGIDGKIQYFYGRWGGGKWASVKEEDWEFYKFMLSPKALQAPDAGIRVKKFFRSDGTMKEGFYWIDGKTVPADTVSGFKTDLTDVLIIGKEQFQDKTWVRFRVTQKGTETRDVMVLYDGKEWNAVEGHSWDLYKFMTDRKAIKAPGAGIDVSLHLKWGYFNSSFYWEDGTTIPNHRKTYFGESFEKILLTGKTRDEGKLWLDFEVYKKDGTVLRYQGHWNKEDWQIRDQAMTGIPIVRENLPIVDLTGGIEIPRSSESTFDIDLLEMAFGHLDKNYSAESQHLGNSPEILIIGAAVPEVEFLFQRYPHSKITVVSLSKGLLEEIQGNYDQEPGIEQKLRLFRADAQKLPKTIFPDASFDLIAASSLDETALWRPVPASQAEVQEARIKVILTKIASEENRLIKPEGLIWHTYNLSNIAKSLQYQSQAVARGDLIVLGGESDNSNFIFFKKQASADNRAMAAATSFLQSSGAAPNVSDFDRKILPYFEGMPFQVKKLARRAFSGYGLASFDDAALQRMDWDMPDRKIIEENRIAADLVRTKLIEAGWEKGSAEDLLIRFAQNSGSASADTFKLIGDFMDTATLKGFSPKQISDMLEQYPTRQKDFPSEMLKHLIGLMNELGAHGASAEQIHRFFVLLFNAAVSESMEMNISTLLHLIKHYPNATAEEIFVGVEPLFKRWKWYTYEILYRPTKETIRAHADFVSDMTKAEAEMVAQMHTTPEQVESRGGSGSDHINDRLSQSIRFFAEQGFQRPTYAVAAIVRSVLTVTKKWHGKPTWKTFEELLAYAENIMRFRSGEIRKEDLIEPKVGKDYIKEINERMVSLLNQERRYKNDPLFYGRIGKKFFPQDYLNLVEGIRNDHAQFKHWLSRQSADEARYPNVNARKYKDTSLVEQKLVEMLTDPSKLRLFLKAASLLRMAFPYDNDFEVGKTPLEYAKEKDLIFPLMDGIRISPATLSFRRHLVGVTGEDGQETWFEVKIPGRDKVSDNNFENTMEVAKEYREAYPEHKEDIAEPIALLATTGAVDEFYGLPADFTQQEPFTLAVFGYEDGNRLVRLETTVNRNGVFTTGKVALDHVFHERFVEYVARSKSMEDLDSQLETATGEEFARLIVEKVQLVLSKDQSHWSLTPEYKAFLQDISVQVMRIGLRFLELGYRGHYFDHFTDWHFENFRLLLSGKVQAVSDFDVFQKEPYPRSEWKAEIKKLFDYGEAYLQGDFDRLYEQALAAHTQEMENLAMTQHDPVAHLKWLKEEFSDEVTEEILSGHDRDKAHYKVRRNWWQGVLADLDSILNVGIFRDNNFKVIIEQFRQDYYSDEFAGRLTDKEDIARANNLIDEILRNIAAGDLMLPKEKDQAENRAMTVEEMRSAIKNAGNNIPLLLEIIIPHILLNGKFIDLSNSTDFERESIINNVNNRIPWSLMWMSWLKLFEIFQDHPEAYDLARKIAGKAGQSNDRIKAIDKIHGSYWLEVERKLSMDELHSIEQTGYIFNWAGYNTFYRLGRYAGEDDNKRNELRRLIAKKRIHPVVLNFNVPSFYAEMEEIPFERLEATFSLPYIGLIKLPSGLEGAFQGDEGMHHLRELYNHQDRNELGYLPAEAINFGASETLNDTVGLGYKSEIIAAIGRIKDKWDRPFEAERYFGEPNPGEDALKTGSQAMLVQTKRGGIDFTANKIPLEISNSDEGIRFHMDPAMLQQLQNAPGFVPVIISIRPMVNLRKFLGLVV